MFLAIMSGINLVLICRIAGADVLFVGNFADNTVMKFDSGGKGVVFANTGLNGPEGLALDSRGNLYVANWGNDTVLKLDRAGRGSVFAGSVLRSPYGLALSAKGPLYVANGANNSIERFDSAGHGTLFVSGIPNPAGLCLDSAGNLYAANFGAGTIDKITPEGRVAHFATGLNQPRYLAIQVVRRDHTVRPHVTLQPRLSSPLDGRSRRSPGLNPSRRQAQTDSAVLAHVH